MPVTAARALFAELHVVARDREAEHRALERLAACAYRYSSRVCIPDDRPGLLLEAGASRRLFGEPGRLGQRLERELGRLGYHAAPGSAPTPEAAWLAAREGVHLERPESLRPALGPLPLRRLQLDSCLIDAMEKMGFRRLRDLLRLPPRTLTRRFGPGLTDYLDRLLGVRADPRPLYHPPETFCSLLQLPAEVHAVQALLFPARRALEELCAALRGSDCAVQELSLVLEHEDHEGSRVALGLQSPTQDAGRLLTVLRERLERLALPGPVRAIRLQAPRLLKFEAGQHTLFRDTPLEQRQDVEQLAERLQARLGLDAVHGLSGVEDHRPEYSWRHRPLGEPPRCVALEHRPAWLLPRPRRCAIADFEILAGPERVESGWWDGRDCRRDYFVVRDAQGSVLWAFHEYKPRHGWFLHGIFS